MSLLFFTIKKAVGPIQDEFSFKNELYFYLAD